MEFLWITDPSILVDPRFANRIFPTEVSTEAEKVNAFTRLVALATVVAYYFLPSKYWIWGVVIIAGIYFRYNTRPETFDYNRMLEDAKRQMSLGVAAPVELPPSQAEQAVEKQREAEKLEEMALRGADIKRRVIQELFADEDSKAVGFARNPREAGNRGEIVWDERQRIYSTRSYIRPSTDEYDDMFYADVGPEKFVTRRT